MLEFTNHTFVICAYKESEYLEECINSLENQTVKSKIILTTATPNEYIDRIAQKHNIEVFVNYGEKGIGQDWNFGVSNTKTDYVTVVHQDDIYMPEFLEEIVKYLNKKKDFVIAFTDYREIKNGEIIPITSNLKIKRMLQRPLLKNGTKKYRKMHTLMLGDAICCPSVTINTKKCGKMPYSTMMKCDLDWETWYELAKIEGNFLYINKELMAHRIHAKSETTNLIENHIRMDEDYEMFRKFWGPLMANLLIHFYLRALKTNK